MKREILKVIKLYLAGLFISYLLFYLLGFREQVVGEDREIDLPDFTLQNQFGEPQSFSSYKGKVILMDFWFAGCGPCLEEMRYYPKLLEKYPGKLVILSYSTDEPAIVQFLVNNHPAPWDFWSATTKAGYSFPTPKKETAMPRR